MLVDRLEGRRVMVVGDVIVDQFVNGAVDRVSPEAPALVLSVADENWMIGGAGNVAMNIATLGSTAILIGVAGIDAAADRLAALVKEAGPHIVDAVVRHADATTTLKTRYVAGDRHLLRTDRERVLDSEAIEAAIIAAVEANAHGCHAVVISDYAKGVITPRVVNAALNVAARLGIPVLADPKRRDFALYAGADVITPNRKELEFATGINCCDDSGCELAAQAAQAITGAAVLLTRSEQGVALYCRGEGAWTEAACARQVRDVSGAGDTIAAICALALAAGLDLRAAAHVANVAAAVAVGKSGTSSVTPQELNYALLSGSQSAVVESKLMPVSSAVALRQYWRVSGLKVGFTNGCFDLLHPGHIRILEGARERCDRLVVGLNSDSSIRRLKGALRPVQTESARADVIGALRSVDLVVLFEEDTPLQLIHALRPDVLAKGADYTIGTVVGADFVQSYGGEVQLIDLVPGFSTTDIIAKSRQPSGK